MTIAWFDGITLTIEAGFASNPSTAIGSTTWTDISTYIRDISTYRGRGSELEQFRAGTANLLVDNRDRRFDPGYTSSPYSPNVLPMKRVRIRVTYSAVTYDVWSGFVDDWPQEYQQPKEASVPLGATDGFKVLALSPVGESVHYYDVTALTPLAWWRLGETTGTAAADSSGNNYAGTYAGGAVFNSTSSLVVGSDNPAIGFDGVDDMVTVTTSPGVFPMSIECMIATTTTASSIYLNVPVAAGAISGSNYECFLEARSDGKLRANVTANGYLGTLYFAGSDAAINDGAPHHIVATWANEASTPGLYVDGVAQGTTGSQGNTGNLNSGVTIGGDAFNKVAAIIDEVAVYPGTLSAGQITTLYSGVSTPWQGDDSGARIGRYLDKANWPSADRTIGTGISTLQAVALASQNALALIQTAENSEQGQFYIGADGKAVFRHRHFRFEDSQSITSQGTFGDSAGEFRYADLVTDGGEQFMANHVRASRSGGVTVDVTDSTSITAYFERLDSSATGLDNQSDDEIRQLANWRLATRKNPIQRVTVLEVRPRGPQLATLLPLVLGLDIGERVTVKRRPQGVGTALTYTVLIEGIQHSIDMAGNWVTRFYLSSSDSNAALQPLILDDATYGLLDTNVLAY